MNFYEEILKNQEKADDYNFTKRIPAAFEKAKNYYQKQAQEQLEEYNRSLLFSNLDSQNGLLNYALHEKNKSNLDIYKSASKLKNINNKTPVEFFVDLDFQEEKQLGIYIDKNYFDREKTINKLNNLENNVGAQAKIKNFFYNTTKEQNKLIENSEILAERMNLAEESLHGWNQMGFQSRLNYLVTRTENDVFEFDQVGFDEMAKNNYIQNQAQQQEMQTPLNQ